MIEYIVYLMEAITGCFNRMACNCHTHLCSCCDISIDVIRSQQIELHKQLTKHFEFKTNYLIILC